MSTTNDQLEAEMEAGGIIFKLHQLEQLNSPAISHLLDELLIDEKDVSAMREIIDYVGDSSPETVTLNSDQRDLLRRNDQSIEMALGFQEAMQKDD